MRTRSQKDEVQDTFRMTPKLEKLLGRIEEDIKNKRNLVGPFKTAKDADKYLDSL